MRSFCATLHNQSRLEVQRVSELLLLLLLSASLAMPG
jgi:hypothetical protein